jgi:protein-disulfide isomerase
MATKKESSSNDSPEPKKSKRLVIPIPVFSFRQSGANGLLVLSLVIFSFLLGMLTNKVIYLQQAANNPTVGGPIQQAAVPTPPPVVKDLSAGKLPVQGNKNAKVTIVEFSDFQCPFCKKFFDDSMQQIMDKYVKTGKVKFAYRHYPLITIHPNAQKAAEASECANEQGKFWEYHDLLFQNQDTWSPLPAADANAKFLEYATENLGLNSSNFQSCLESGKYKKNVETDIADAAKAQADSTPTIFVNGNRLIGALPFAEFEKIIEQELKK